MSVSPPLRVDPHRVVTELLAIRNQMLAMTRIVELTLRDLGVLRPEDGIDHARLQSPPPVDEDGACTHPVPARAKAPVMGKPDRFYCRACGEVVNDEKV